ncbi:MAG: EAL domain-containing protein [Rhodobacteraceae bacterium]|nr:EAL domain-containing protein [Paracoccaceae bacterium]
MGRFQNCVPIAEILAVLLAQSSIRVKTLLMIGAAALAMAALMTLLMAEFRHRIEKFHIEQTKTALAAARAIILHEHNSVLEDSRHTHFGDDQGAHAPSRSETEAEARAHVMEQLRAFRYDNGEGYIAIVSDQGQVLMHPITPELEGRDNINMQDSDGRYIMQEALQIGRENEIGLNTYHFAHPVTGEIGVKTSAIMRYDPWGWTMIAGVFQRKINAEMAEVTRRGLLLAASLLAGFLLLAWALAQSLTRPISALTNAMGAIASGDLEHPVPHTELRNECGEMARALTVFRDSARRVQFLQCEKLETQRAAEAARVEMTRRLRADLGEVLRAGADGDFSRRVPDDFDEASLQALAQGINHFVDVVDANVSAVGEAMEALTDGKDFTAPPELCNGAFGELMTHINTAAEKIRLHSLELEESALHDALTGLPNRRYLEREIEALKAASEVSGDKRRSDDQVAMLHIDLDRFKQINDSLGHAAGDEVLTQVSNILRDVVRAEDFVARVGGDEFVMVCRSGASADSVCRIAERLVERLAEPVIINGRPVRMGASVGVAQAAVSVIEPAQILINADLALYRAKQTGRRRMHFFTDDLHQELLAAQRLSEELYQAFERDEFVAYLQPLVDSTTLEVTSFEALARWRHPTRGMLTPPAFLSQAYDLGLIARIDHAILLQAGEAVKKLRQLSGRPLKVSVNVSLKRLSDPALLNEIDKLDLEPGSLSFELLETIFFDQQDQQFTWTLDQLRERGIGIDLDDFGSGHASITSLTSVRPDRLKVDRTLVRPLLQGAQPQRLISAIVEIGNAFDMDVVAEGVETMEHAAVLRDLGCHHLQGYAFAPPLPFDRAAALIAGPTRKAG